MAAKRSSCMQTTQQKQVVLGRQFPLSDRHATWHATRSRPHLGCGVVGGIAELQQHDREVALLGRAVQRALRLVQPLAIGRHEGRASRGICEHLDGVDAWATAAGGASANCTWV